MRRGEALRHALAKPGAWQDEPWEGDVVAYIGRSGWNTVQIGGAVPDDEILELIDESYDAVVAKLPKSRRPGPG